MSRPWSANCPAALSARTFTWTAGESVLVGRFTSNGKRVTWYGEACSGLLVKQYAYAGAADLKPTATSLVNGFDSPYYGALNHQRAELASAPVSVGGHPGWEVKFLMTYQDAASLRLPWSSEVGAVVVVDRGAGAAPAVFYVSIPDNLKTADVDSLVQSLQAAQLPPAGQLGRLPSAGPSHVRVRAGQAAAVWLRLCTASGSRCRSCPPPAATSHGGNIRYSPPREPQAPPGLP